MKRFPERPAGGIKAHLKYAFMSGRSARYPVFAVCLLFYCTFGILGSLGLAPYPALVTAVAIGGVGIAVMFVVNLIDDMSIIRGICHSPGAYLNALTPAPRWKTLLAGCVSILAQGIVTLAAVIIGQVWLAFNLIGRTFWREFFELFRFFVPSMRPALSLIVVAVSALAFLLMLILFAMIASKSIFYKKPAADFLAFLSACGVFYLSNLIMLVLAPFGDIVRHGRHGLFLMLTINGAAGTALYGVMLLLQAAGLFILTAYLMERKMNI